ncbi:MAG: hypothetical protein JW857_03285 [Bacteroidales bacterium]|nr:hypothetical protein [Bacteroidales bacterium]
MKLAVVGNPVEHSKSPLIFQFLFETLKWEATYERILLQSAKEIPLLFKKGLSGINITAPFKQEVFPFIDKLSEDATEIGSVNTVVHKDGMLIGYNTDYLGVINALEEKVCDLSSKYCLVLGAGGAASAAIFGLKQRDAVVQLYNRSQYKSKELAAKFDVDYIDEYHLQKAVENADIIVDTLPADIQLLNPDWLHAGLTVLDASYPNSVYEQSKTVQLIKGENWLLHQALPAFQLFTGFKIKKHNYDQQALLDLLMK